MHIAIACSFFQSEEVFKRNVKSQKTSGLAFIPLQHN